MKNVCTERTCWFPYAYSGGTMSLRNCPGPMPLIPSFRALMNGPPGVPAGVPTVNPYGVPPVTPAPCRDVAMVSLRNLTSKWTATR